MTLLQLNVLLWVYARPGVPPDEFSSAEVLNHAVEKLQALGLIVGTAEDIPKDHWGYGVTAKGEALIEHILSLPMPEQLWVIPS